MVNAVGSYHTISYFLTKRNMNKNTNLIGTITELKCFTHFLELGYNVSIPQTPCRYDCIVDTGKNLFKIQIKTSNTTRTEGCINFSVCSSHQSKGSHTHVDYKDDNIDFFCTVHEEEYYLVPISECGKREKNLRLVPTKSGQVKGISFAKDYICKEVLKLL